MLIMDSNSSDHSPPLSENAGSSWHNWENEISSISGLNLADPSCLIGSDRKAVATYRLHNIAQVYKSGSHSSEQLDSTSELSGLVEDKEIAARAVAFVVNSTRKGIVPLCADIANLLRAKRSLEKKVFLLKRENEALRGSTGNSFRTSHSTSPTPPSFSSFTDKSLLQEHGASMQERSRPCSRCSQCSSTVSNSPKFEKTYSFKGHLHSPPDHHRSSRRSPRAPRRPPNGLTSQALVHCVSDASTHDSGFDLSRGAARKNSLPEIISEPDRRVMRVSPKISKEVQCTLLRHSDSPLEEQFIETVRLNSKLAEELGSARKEIEILKGRLKELEMNHLARECWREQYHMEDECEDSHSINLGDERPLQATHPSCSVVVKRHYALNGTSRSRLHCQFAPVPGSVLYAEPLYGCKCTACDEAMGGEIHASLAQSLNQELQKFPVNSKLQVQLGDHVVVKGERTGRIRYIGHLDKIGQPNMVFVGLELDAPGLELDAPVGRHDGFFNGKRYFFCHKDHGIFLPLHDIVCKVQPKKSKSMEDGAGRDMLQSKESTGGHSLPSHELSEWPQKQSDAEKDDSHDYLQ
ncbi:hypothetical protein BaRGS_00000847 [Batillaria attramentaria]|uniref:CAP-Gly domain-containing protein n=1 Tax=Batillaria attramentaria TaxID=370345 RepID=A0ABD0M929_9CAEN